MPSDATFINVRKSFQAIAGLESMTEMDNFFFEQSMNRAAQRAYDASPSWPRYLVPSELRRVAALTVDNVSVDSGVPNQPYRIYAVQSQGGGNAGGQVSSGLQSNIYVTNTSPSRYLIRKYAGNTWLWTLASAPTFQANTDGSAFVSAISGVIAQSYSIVTLGEENPWDVSSWVDGTADANSVNISIEEALVIPYSQTGLGNVGEFIRVHKQKSTIKNSALEYDFFIDSQGANVIDGSANVITHSNEGSGLTEYSNNLYATYKKKYSSAFTETSTDVPAEFFDYIIYSVLADFYTGDGQTEKALIAEQTAEKMLEKELFKIDIKSNNNSINRKFSTYVNRQSR